MTKNDQPSPERTDVLVFAEGPEWDELNGRKWFHVRGARLLETISVLDDHFSEGIEQIRAIYPNTVLIY
jgi:hypothetical protein